MCPLQVESNYPREIFLSNRLLNDKVSDESLFYEALITMKRFDIFDKKGFHWF